MALLLLLRPTEDTFNDATLYEIVEPTELQGRAAMILNRELDTGEEMLIDAASVYVFTTLASHRILKD